MIWIRNSVATGHRKHLGFQVWGKLFNSIYSARCLIESCTFLWFALLFLNSNRAHAQVKSRKPWTVVWVWIVWKFEIIWITLDKKRFKSNYIYLTDLALWLSCINFIVEDYEKRLQSSLKSLNNYNFYNRCSLFLVQICFRRTERRVRNSRASYKSMLIVLRAFGSESANLSKLSLRLTFHKFISSSQFSYPQSFSWLSSSLTPSAYRRRRLPIISRLIWPIRFPVLGCNRRMFHKAK